jgi:hypothetical protein
VVGPGALGKSQTVASKRFLVTFSKKIKIYK